MTRSLTYQIQQNYIINDLLYNTVRKYDKLDLYVLTCLRKYIEKLFMVIEPQYYSNIIISKIPARREVVDILSEQICNYLIKSIYKHTYHELFDDPNKWRFLMCSSAELQKILIRHYFYDIVLQMSSVIDREIELNKLYEVFCLNIDEILPDLINRAQEIAKTYTIDINLRKIIGDVLDNFELYICSNVQTVIDHLRYFMDWFYDNGTYLLYIAYQMSPYINRSPLTYKNFIRYIFTQKGYDYSMKILSNIMGAYLIAVRGYPFRQVITKLQLARSVCCLNKWVNRIRYLV